MPKAIVHLDADAFFASVEQAADPRLRGKPVAVGGEKRGIIASASYEARKFGVYTPMPTVRARKLCPKLIVLPGDYDRYEDFSRWMFSYAYDFTPDVEQTSIDEGYFDLTGARKAPAGHRPDHPQGHRAIAQDHGERGHRRQQARQPDRLQAQQTRRLCRSAARPGNLLPSSVAEQMAAGHRPKGPGRHASANWAADIRLRSNLSQNHPPLFLGGSHPAFAVHGDGHLLNHG